MKNTITGLVVLVALLVGIIIGLLISPRSEAVYAQQKQPAPAVQTCSNSSDVECVSPMMTMGSAGIGKLLANQISADQVIVGGYDLLKLQNNMISAMIRGGVISPDGAKAIAEASHPDKYLRFQPPSPPPATANPPSTAPKP